MKNLYKVLGVLVLFMDALFANKYPNIIVIIADDMVSHSKVYIHIHVQLLSYQFLREQLYISHILILNIFLYVSH